MAYGQTRNERWLKPSSFHVAQERSCVNFSSVRDEICTERQNNWYWGWVPLWKRNAKMAIFKNIPFLAGCQWSFLRCGLKCSCLHLRRITLAALFGFFSVGTLDQKWFQWVRSSVQVNPLTNWVVGGTWGAIQQRSSSSHFCRRPSWSLLTWTEMSTLWCCPSSISSADHGLVPPSNSTISLRVKQWS